MSNIPVRCHKELDTGTIQLLRTRYHDSILSDKFETLEVDDPPAPETLVPGWVSSFQGVSQEDD